MAVQTALVNGRALNQCHKPASFRNLAYLQFYFCFALLSQSVYGEILFFPVAHSDT